MPPKCYHCGHEDRLEGAIDQKQLTEIMNTRGITWEIVYEKLFPDEPIPDKCEHPKPLSTGGTKGNTDFEDLSTAFPMTLSGEDTKLAECLHANMRGYLNHATSDQFTDEQIRAGRAQLGSTPYVGGVSMLPQQTSSDWPPRQLIEHSTYPQANPQLGETSLLQGHTDFTQASNIGAPAFPWDLGLTATTGNGSYDAVFQNSQSNLSDFTNSTCLCVCHHHPQEPCCCSPDCWFYKAPTDVLLG